MTLLRLALTVGIVVATGCATDSTFRAPGLAAADDGTAPRLILDERDVGAIDAHDGLKVPVPPGVGPVQWKIVDGGEVLGQGTLERDQVAWGVVAGAGVAAACCIPTMALTGFCVANPAILASPLACALGNLGVCSVALQAPGWTTVPLTTLGAALGATPLAFGLMGAHLSPEVTLTTPPPSSAPPSEPATESAAPVGTSGRSSTSGLSSISRVAQREEAMWF
jgi:hypothetical protein